ncbi:VCBS domain-containing protein [Vibrio sp. ZSDE26]|uniref:VCBS domain-containing protein n=1 Tax=Vibrio amylolyticus TaxID=2847292 RepID=A0A9X1XIA1_9VIBR|nr:VCBS domain-containing protein [Vibrio amylolyticus]MCK6263727.1 VCBS domain-containing protein [Vibrio amylolyticus]
MTDKNNNKEKRQSTNNGEVPTDKSKRARINASSEQSPPNKRLKKVRLYNRLRINVPLSQTLMLILPSLSKHVQANMSADDGLTSGDKSTSHDSPMQVKSNPLTHHPLNNLAETNQSEISNPTSTLTAQSTTESVNDKHISAISSHHLVSNMHPQVHYIPEIAFPILSHSISSGSTTPSLVEHASAPNVQVTTSPYYIPETIQGKYGELHVDASGKYTFILNPNSPDYISLQQNQSGTDPFILHLSNGAKLVVQVPILGKQDAPTITGDLKGAVTEDHQVDSHGLITTQGKIDVIDPDHNESGVSAESIQGHYGIFSIDEHGHWQYQVNNSLSNIQALTAATTSLHESFTIHTQDGTPQTIDMTIGGNDDNAIIAGVDAGVVREDLMTQVQGQLSVTDSDHGEDHFQASYVNGQLGSFVIEKDGAWTYILDNHNPIVQRLGQGSAATDTIIVHSADGTAHHVTITIKGTNDRPNVSHISSQTVNEGDHKISGQVTATDVDYGDTATFATTYQHPGFTLNSDGSYTLDPTDPSFNHLAVGEHQTLIIPVTATDNSGGQSPPQNLVIRIDGTNDLPVVSGVSTGNTVEQGTNAAGITDVKGTLIASDLDTSDTIKWTVSQAQGQLGTLSIDQHGHWHYQLDNSSGSTTDQLALGQHQSESFWVTATDSAGASVPHKIVIDVIGSNDKPVVSAWTQLPAGKEDQPVTIKATDLLTHASDVDSTDTLNVINLQATHGSIIDNKDGTYTFIPDRDFNGEIRLTYNVVDGHGGSVSTQAKFDLTAAPDNAVITDVQMNADLRGVTEDHGYIDTHYKLHYDGQLNIQDPDAGEAQFDPNIGPQTYQGIGYDTKLGGHILLMRDGHYTYTLDNRNIQNLAHGEVKHDSVVIRSADGTTHTIELTVHGTNDAPTINAQSHSVTEGGSVLNGQMIGHDIDTGATLTYSSPQVDGLVVNPDGSYSFNPAHSTYQSLASGVTKTLTVPVTVTDEHNASSIQNLSITITGSNNAATISGVSAGDVEEGHGNYGDRSPDHAQPGMAKLGQDGLTADGKLDILDPDTGESVFDSKGGAWNNSYHGQYGHLLLNTDGTWHYHVTVGSVDWVGNRTTTIGTTIDKLGENQTLTDTITVYSKDGTAHDIVITIHGDNDRPYISSEVSLTTGTEDTVLTFTKADLLANAVDVDSNDAGKLSIANLLVDHGSVADNKDGTYTFTPTKDYNGQVHFSYDVKDAHGGVTHTGATTTFVAVNDNPDVTPTSDSVTEDTDSHHSVNLLGTATDVDGDPLTISQIQVSFEGHTGPLPVGIGIAPDGHTLIIDSHSSAFQHLSAGQKSDITVHYMVEDNHGGQTPATATITVVGTDDRAQLQSSTIDITEGQALHTYNGVTFMKGLISLTDPDSSDQTHFIFSLNQGAKGFGELTVWPDGRYSYNLDWVRNHHANDKVAALKQGETLTDQYQVHTSDGQIKLVTVTIHGEDNNARIEVLMPHLLPTTQDVYEEHFKPASPTHLYAGGMLKVVDPDHDDAFLQPEIIATAHQGEFKIRANGDWSYMIDNSIAEVQHLGAGESFTETHTVHSKDGTASQLLTVTVHGTNDAPTVSAEVKLAPGVEDTDIQLSTSELLSHASDIDHNDIGRLNIANLVTDHGVIIDNKDGTYTFQPAKDYNGQVHFTYDVIDGHGGITHTGANTSLAAVNDVATFTGDSGSVDEDTSLHHNLHITGATTIQDALTCNGHLIVSDADGQGEAALDLNGQHHLTQSGTYGQFVINSSGIWVYAADNNNVAIQDLDNGQTLTDHIEVTSKDGTKHSITVTINGTTDDPVLHSLSDSGVQHGGPIEGNLLTGSGTDQGLSGAATDTDSNAHLVLQDIQIKDPVSGYVAVRPGQPHTMAGIGTLAIEANGHYTFTPEAGFTGKVPSMVYRVGDDGGNPIGDSSQNSLSIEVTPPLQHTPTVTGQTVSTNEDITRTITTSEFGYSDQDGDALQFVTISSIPSHGLLLLNGNAVTANQHISKADLDAGHLTFTPINNENGANYAQFSFTANDGHTNSASATMILDVNAVNDAPIVGSSFISSLEDKPHTFTTADFKYSDIDGDTLNHITITNVTHGVLSLNGITVNVGDDVSASDVSSLIFIPTHNYFSSGVSGLGAVQFTANDGQANSKEGSILINIASVADPATFSGDSSGVVKEDITLQASGTLTASDPDGTAEFTAVQGGAGIAGSKGYGHAHIDVNGHWTYDLNNNHPVVQQLAQGQTDTETITVQSIDGTQHDIVITITGTNDLPTVSERPQAGLIVGQHSVEEDSTLAPTGQLVINDIDGDSTSVTLDPTHSANYGHVAYDAHNGAWVYHLDNSNPTVNALNDNDTLQDRFSVLVDDGHGRKVSQEITMTINGHTDTPPIPTLVTPAQITGSAGHQDLHASLGTPPQLLLSIPTLQTGWGILTANGHVASSLHGQFGTLHVNPQTGHLDYDYHTSSSVIKTHTGTSNGAGTDETDTFVLTLAGTQNSKVEVHLHLHSQSVHGNSGHHIDQTTLTGIDVNPLSSPSPPPPVQHDEPDTNIDSLNDSLGDVNSHSAANAYLSALGIAESSPSSGVNVQHNSPHDLDIVLNESQDIANAATDSNAVDAADALSYEHHLDHDKHPDHDSIDLDNHQDSADPSSFIDPV